MTSKDSVRLSHRKLELNLWPRSHWKNINYVDDQNHLKTCLYHQLLSRASPSIIIGYEIKEQ